MPATQPKGGPECPKKSPVLITIIQATSPETSILMVIATSKTRKKGKFQTSTMIIRVINPATLISTGIAIGAVRKAADNLHIRGMATSPSLLFKQSSTLRCSGRGTRVQRMRVAVGGCPAGFPMHGRARS